MTWSCGTDGLAVLELQTLAMFSAGQVDVQLTSPRDCWELIKTSCPDPDKVDDVQAAFDAITAINTATHAEATASQWWVDMIGYHDVLASRMRAGDV